MFPKRYAFLVSLIYLSLAMHPAPVNAVIPVEQVAPEYPAVYLTEGKQGRAVIEVTINPDGTVGECLVAEESDAGFGQAALEAAQQWLFEPLESDEPKKVRIPFEFKLSFHQRMNLHFGREVFRELDPEMPVIDPQVFEDRFRPQPTRRAVPRYPERLVGSGKKAKVRVDYYVDEDGKAINPVIVDPDKVDDEFIMPSLLAAIVTEWRPLYTSTNRPAYLKIRETYEFFEGMDDEENEDADGVDGAPKKRNSGGGWFGRRKQDD